MKNLDASLELSQEKARKLGHALVEHLVEYQARVASPPVVKVEGAAALVFNTELRGQTLLRLSRSIRAQRKRTPPKRWKR